MSAYRFSIRALAAVALASVIACGGDSTGPGDDDDDDDNPIVLANGSMSARIDGAQWRASAAIAATNNNGLVAIAGTDGTGRTIAFGVIAGGTGTFTTNSTSGTNFLIAEGGASWHALLTTGNGSITFTTLTATRAVGSFSFTAPPVGGTTASGTRNVTQGAFDVTF